MTPLPTPSRRVLAELAALLPADPGLDRPIPSAVRRAFVELTTLLDAHDAALAELDRIEADLVARHDYPRVALPARSDTPPAYAADAATIRRQLGLGPPARRLTAALHRRQRRFRQAADAAGVPAVRARTRDFATRIDDTTTSLLLAPTGDPLDLAVKVIVLTAMCEPGPADGAAFPGVYLRTLFVDLVRLHGTMRTAP